MTEFFYIHIDSNYVLTYNSIRRGVITINTNQYDNPIIVRKDDKRYVFFNSYFKNDEDVYATEKQNILKYGYPNRLSYFSYSLDGKTTNKRVAFDYTNSDSYYSFTDYYFFHGKLCLYIFPKNQKILAYSAKKL